MDNTVFRDKEIGDIADQFIKDHPILESTREIEKIVNEISGLTLVEREVTIFMITLHYLPKKIFEGGEGNG